MAEHRPYAHLGADTWVCPYAGEDMPFDRLRANGKKSIFKAMPFVGAFN